jgi:hypothetical protein
VQQAPRGVGAAFDHGGDGEPAVAIQPDGTTWVTGIAGVGAGIGLWKIAATDACAQSPGSRTSPMRAWAGRYRHRHRHAAERARPLQHLYVEPEPRERHLVDPLDGGATFALTPISTPSIAQDRGGMPRTA